ncbi:FeoC-like transcriptional regulator [Methanocaldococcus sp.]
MAIDVINNYSSHDPRRALEEWMKFKERLQILSYDANSDLIKGRSSLTKRYGFFEFSPKWDKQVINFDLKKFCEIEGLNYELLSYFCSTTWGLLQLYNKLITYFPLTKWKINLVNPKFDFDNIDLSNEDLNTIKLYNQIKSEIENYVFKEFAPEDLYLEKVRNVYAVYEEISERNEKRKKYIAVFPKPKVENIKYFDGNKILKKQLLKIRGETLDLNEEESFYEFIQLIKNGNINIGNYLIEYDAIFNFVTEYFDNNKFKRITESWGYFGKGKAIFRGWDIKIEEDRAREFKELLETQYTEEEIKEIINLLYQYLGNDELSKIIFEYYLASLFRYYLMDTRRLDKFPYLLIKGKQGIGKSARMSIFNKMFLNTENAYSADDVRGSASKIAKEQYINLPMWFDELTEFPNRLKEMLKKLGTKKDDILKRGNKSMEKEDYRFYIRRPFIISTNKFSLDDPALLDRFIVVDANECYLENHSDIGKKLFPIIHKLGVWIYDNIEDFREFVDSLKFPYDREYCNKIVMHIGRELAKYLFGKFGLTYNPSPEIREDYDIILTSKDILQKKIINNTIKLSEYLRDGIKYNILDYFEDPTEHDVVEKLLSKYGIFPYTDKLGNNYIAITKTGLLYLDLEEENIKKLSDLEAHGFKQTVIWKNNKSHRVVLIPVGEEREDPTLQKVADRIIELLTGKVMHIVDIFAIVRQEFNISEEKIEEVIKKLEGKCIQKVGDYKYTAISREDKKRKIREYIWKKGKATITEICAKFDLDVDEAEEILKELCKRGEIEKINETTYIS